MTALSTFLGYPEPLTFLMLVTAAFLGGLVRGFTGFGFAMVFVPIATVAVGPVGAAALIWLIDIPFAWPLAAAGFRRVAWREVFPLLIGAIICAPLGVWLLTTLEPMTARWVVAIAILCGVTLLASGYRYKGAPGNALSLGVGGLSGTASGLAQLGGMPIAIFWLAAQKNDPRQTRDNLNGFFAILPIFTGLLYWWKDVLTWQWIMQALPLCVPYGLALYAGTRLFSVASEQTFRRIAYAVIILAAFIALPLTDKLIGR
ncbi:MAG: sulfite exporter TauE/SafE family protein [Beijerinckiaceae bacterium]